MIDLKKQHILVTGGGGFLGQHVLSALRSRGVSQKNIFAPRSSEHDLRKKEDCEAVTKGIDLVIHLAGLTGGGALHRDRPGEVFFDNIAMGINIMEAARVAGVKKIVVAGSATEYPADAPIPLKEEILWDGFPEPSHAPYSIAKRTLLVQGQAYRSQYGLNVVHLVLTNMYGPFAKPDAGPIPAFIDRIAKAKRAGDKEVSIFGTGKATRDYLYGADAAEAILLAVEKYDKPEPINIGSGKEISIAEIAETVVRLSSFPGKLKFDPSKSNDTSRRVLEVSKAKKEFGFSATTPFEIGLQKTIEWYNAQT